VCLCALQLGHVLAKENSWSMIHPARIDELLDMRQRTLRICARWRSALLALRLANEVIE
jgi:hypothetical protein